MGKANKNSKRMLVAVDLFSGGGGLTAGLKRAGFVVSAAVEYDKHAAETYTANHPATVLYTSDIRQVTGAQLLSTSPTGQVDLVAACPPCQSFSSLTSKYKRKDARDELIFEFERIVAEIMPTTIMMENVPGLSKKGAHLFEPVTARLRELGYELSYRWLRLPTMGYPREESDWFCSAVWGVSCKFPSQRTLKMAWEVFSHGLRYETR